MVIYISLSRYLKTIMRNAYCLRYINKRIGAALQAILPEETHPQAVSTCVDIACRLAVDKVEHWMNTYVGVSKYWVS